MTHTPNCPTNRTVAKNPRHHSALSFLLAIGALSSTTACAGSRYQVRANTAHEPVSFSPVLPGRDGTPLYLGHELKAVGTLHYETTSYGLLYGATGRTVDISDAVNRQVQRSGGEGVVSLAVTSKYCALNYLFPLTLLPFWPGCQHVTVDGVVVRADHAGSTQRTEAAK